MTVTPPFAGPRAARIAARIPARAAARRIPARAAAAIAALATALTLALLPLPAVAAPPPAEPLTFAMAPTADGVVREDMPVILSLATGNPTASTVAAGDVRIELGRTPLGDRDAVRAWLAEERGPGTFDQIAGVRLDSLAARGERTTTLPIPADEFAGLAAGVYPLRATYASGQGPLTATSVLVVPEPDAELADVAVVVPITAGARASGLLTAEELAELTGPGGSLRAQLDAVANTPAVLAIDPSLAASVRVLGTAAPESATQWLDQLLTLPNTRFALQFGDADLATQVHAELSRPLRVTTLAPSLDPGDFAVPNGTPDAGGAGPTPDPTATDATPDEPALPDLDALLDIGATRGDVYWPATGTAGSEVAAYLGALEGEADAPLTLLASSAVDASPVSARSRAGDADLAVYDADVSAQLHAASRIDDTTDRAGALAAATAYANFAPARSTLLVTVDRGADRSRLALRDAITTATGLPGRTAVDLVRLAAQPASEVELITPEADTARAAVLLGFQEDEADLTQFATILADPAMLTAPERAAILQLIGSGWRDTPTTWRAAVDAHRAQTSATLDAVAIERSDDVNLLGSSAPLVFSVRNNLPYPVSLVLVTTPNDPLLIVQTTTPVEVGAQQNTRANVPVEARVGSGVSSLDLQLRSPTMVAIGDRQTIEVTVRAEWESIGVIVMAVLVGGLLVLGAARTILRLRRRTATVRPPAGAATPEDSSSEEGAPHG